MTAQVECEVIELSSIEPEQLYDFQQQVLFSPSRRGEGFIKLAVSSGKKGALSVSHSHPRDEVTLTLKGQALLRANGKEYLLTKGTAVRIPPGLDHTVEVVSDEWVVVAAYCDECSLCRGAEKGSLWETGSGAGHAA